MLKFLTTFLKNILVQKGHLRNVNVSCVLTTMETKKTLKSDSQLPQKILFICLKGSPSTMMKNAFYFFLKALLVLKIFKFLS